MLGNSGERPVIALGVFVVEKNLVAFLHVAGRVLPLSARLQHGKVLSSSSQPENIG